MNPSRPARGAVKTAARRAARADGRAVRWQGHRQERRREFVDAALQAIRRDGPQVGLDEIAAAAGVSKPVLYRHFTDKDDLITAVLDAVIEQLLLPRVTDALERYLRRPPADVDVQRLLRDVIAVYVHLVVDEPHVYRFVFLHKTAGGQGDFVAATEGRIATTIAALMTERLRQTPGGDAGAAEPWAYGVVGMVQLAVQRWVDHPTMTEAALVDYLVALAWQGLGPALAPAPPTG